MSNRLDGCKRRTFHVQGTVHYNFKALVSNQEKNYPRKHGSGRDGHEYGRRRGGSSGYYGKKREGNYEEPGTPSTKKPEKGTRNGPPPSKQDDKSRDASKSGN